MDLGRFIFHFILKAWFEPRPLHFHLAYVCDLIEEEKQQLYREGPLPDSRWGSPQGWRLELRKSAKRHEVHGMGYLPSSVPVQSRFKALSWATFVTERLEERCSLSHSLLLFLPMIPAGEASRHLGLPLSLAFLGIQGSRLGRRPLPCQAWRAVRHKVWEHAYQGRNPLQLQLCMSWDHNRFYGQDFQFFGVCVETKIGGQKKPA